MNQQEKQTELLFQIRELLSEMSKVDYIKPEKCVNNGSKLYEEWSSSSSIKV